MRHLSDVDKEKEMQSEKHLHEATRQRQNLEHASKQKETKKKGD